MRVKHIEVVVVRKEEEKFNLLILEALL